MKLVSASASAVYVLVGPTAAGKTELAHCLARRHGAAILSADSMLVYRGLDIGTAKPTQEERAGILYGGIDLADPDENFSTAQYLEAARRFIHEQGARPVIVAGGTGLYVKALLLGLEDVPAGCDVWRAEAETMLSEKGLQALQQVVQAEAPAHYAALADNENPRRLIRAMELARAGAPVPMAHAQIKPQVTGIRYEREALLERIELRVELMFEAGLIEEAVALRAAGKTWSKTALQAIGYAEAFDYLDEKLTKEQAVERIVIRTRQLAKRQGTWFRNQLQVSWAEAVPGVNCTEELADQIEKFWKEHGPSQLAE